MVIRTKNQENVIKFRDLNYGECFQVTINDEPEYFMKIRALASYNSNCVNLRTGECDTMRFREEVQKVNAEVIINGEQHNNS